MITFAFLLSVAALVSAYLTIRFDNAGRKQFVYAFKPLSTVLILFVALLAPTGEWGSYYQLLIAAGLLFSLAGDVFLMLPKDRFIPGLASFLIAHLLYVMAFSQPQWSGNWWILAGLLLFAVVYYKVLLSYLGSKKVPVALYFVAIILMVWQAVSKAIELGTEMWMLAAFGAALFMLSDAILAIRRFVNNFPSSQTLVLGTYFPGQLLIAWSV